MALAPLHEPEHETAQYWRLTQCLVQEKPGDPMSHEDAASALDELEYLAGYTSSDRLRQLCIKTLRQYMPLRTIGDSL